MASLPPTCGRRWPSVSSRRRAHSRKRRRGGSGPTPEPAHARVADMPLDPDDTGALVGRTIGPYKVIRPLGAGGMGAVFLAQDSKLGRQVALKLLPVELTRDTDRVRRFEQEARAASALNHPNIITIHDSGDDGD